MTEGSGEHATDRRVREENTPPEARTEGVRVVPDEQLAKLHPPETSRQGDASASALHPEVSSNLALAVIAASPVPILLLDSDCKVLAASGSFYQVFELDQANVIDRSVAALGVGEWAVPQLDALIRATASGNAGFTNYEMDLRRQGRASRRLMIDAHKLDHGSGILLLTIADVTDMRLAGKIRDDLLREKTILLQELQHRVANSLQIIASVLIQSARRVNSEEVRSHLHDAHHRVMSVATLQQQLAISTIGQVELRSYLTDLCRSISASMIRDHDQLSLDVSIQPGSTSADVSVSLGLIVTELVINALKHAFPEHAGGRIEVGYRSNGRAWALSVSDNGIGMLAPSAFDHSGLGSSIVEALARKLKAKVEITDAAPGSMVRIVHR